MNNESNTSSKDYLFELSGYILNCAEMVLSPRGSTRYSVLRFIDVLRRVIDLPEYADCFPKDEYLIQLKKKLSTLPIEGNQLEELNKELQVLLLEYAEEAGKRL